MQRVHCEHNINILKTGCGRLFHDLASWCKGGFQAAQSSWVVQPAGVHWAVCEGSQWPACWVVGGFLYSHAF